MPEKPKKEKETYGKPGDASPDEIEDGFVLGDEDKQPHRPEGDSRGRPPVRRHKPSGIEAYKPFIITGIAILIVAYMMISALAVSKKDFTTNLQGIATTIEGVRKGVADSKALVDTAVAGIPDTITDLVTYQVGETVKVFEDWRARADNTIASINNEIAAVRSDVASVKDSVKSNSDALTANSARIDEMVGWRGRVDTTVSNNLQEITDLEARIVVLEARRAYNPADNIGDSPISVSASVTNYGGAATEANDYGTTISIKITLVNSEDADLEDIIIYVPIEIYTSSSQHLTAWNVITSGWRLREWGEDYVIIKATGIKLDANETEKIRVSIGLGFSGAVSNIDVEIDDDDIEIIEWDYE
ncbi:hypothetical protein LCGC14_1714630 [marine sediment metagenome]|uniref:Uncharacterized protein n=1 Tax=marine sediment metagenome TaxID=412755 RepID=A0A0F9KE93_9ZZZZ